MNAHLLDLILSLLSQGADSDELLDDNPGLEPEDIRACIAYAHAVIAKDSLATVSVAERAHSSGNEIAALRSQ